MVARGDEVHPATGGGDSRLGASGRDASSISIVNVSKSFVSSADGSRVPALRGLSLEVAAGEMVSLLGPSGCGKSTLLRLIAGLESPDEGVIRVGGEQVIGPSARRGLMFQDPNLFPWLTVRGNVSVGPRARGALSTDKRSEVEDFLRLVGLDAFAEAYPHHLSGGMAQRAALARALVNHPEVLLLDEPLGALDAFTRMRMQDEVLRLWLARRTTMLLVTHDVDEAIYMSDRIVLLTDRPGRVDRVVDVTLPRRPRNRSDANFLALRGEILRMLHFAGAAGASGDGV